jgi:hypothetical protein
LALFFWQTLLSGLSFANSPSLANISYYVMQSCSIPFLFLFVKRQKEFPETLFGDPHQSKKEVPPN